jgi:hypothetical protein
MTGNKVVKKLKENEIKNNGRKNSRKQYDL